MTTFKKRILIGLSVSALAMAAIGCSPATTASNETPTATPSATETEVSSLESLSKDLSIKQVSVASLPSAPPVAARDLRIEAKVDKASYKIGETVQVSARPNKDAYIWVVNVHDDGKMEMLFPNKFNSDNFVAANKEIVLPPAGGSYSYTVGGKPGADLVQVFATLTAEPPLPAMSTGTAAFSKGLGTLELDAESLSKDLNLVVEKVNCAVSKDLNIVASADTKPAAGAKPSAQPVSFEELCGAPGTSGKPSPGQAPTPVKDWRNLGFASTSAVFKIQQ